MLKFASKLNFYFQNVRGLRTKTNDLYINSAKCEYDVIILNETWLNNSFMDAELFTCYYNVYRRDRETSPLQRKKGGGGVLVAISKKIKSCNLKMYESDCEDLWIEIDVLVDKKIEKLLLCTVYFPPPVLREHFEHFCNHASSILSKYNLTLICGDFNQSNIDWIGTPGSPLTPKINTSCATSNDLLEFMSLNQLSQHNYITNRNGKTLDLILTNMPINNILSSTEPLSKIDVHHPALIFHASFNYSSHKLQTNKDSFKNNFYKADYNSICDYLSRTDWPTEFSTCTSVDSMVDRFYQILNVAIKKFVPISSTAPRKTPVWYTKELKMLLKEKNKYRVRFKKYKNPLDNLSFNSLKKRCDILITQCYNKYIELIEKSVNSNPKLFFTYIKQKNKNSASFPSSLNYDNTTVSSGPGICNTLAAYFSTSYSIDEAEFEFDNQAGTSCMVSYSLSNLSFSEGQVLQRLKSLDRNKGAGADGIPSIFVVNCAKQLSSPLTSIFNTSLALGMFPSVWKTGLIVPIHKSGDINNATNYRPITILSVFAKLLESLICPYITWHINSVLSDSQHGFVAARSTSTNLTDFVDELSLSMDNRIPVDVIYTDLSKAFDKVPHNILLQKLSQLGFAGAFLDWCSSYLRDRTSKVVVSGFTSNPFPNLSGVPQGSHLGPIFFNIYMNDVISCFRYSKPYLYADDLKLMRPIRNGHDKTLLQDDLNRFVLWCQNNRMVLNIDKCCFITFTRKISELPGEYTINGECIRQVDHVRDLGVVLDKQLNFKEHYNHIVNKSFKCLGFIIRNSKTFKNKSCIIRLYESLVRSMLEYCCVVWNPYYEVHSNKIERVQKRFMYHLSYKYNLCKKLKSYNDRLNYFKLTSLKNRRKILNLSFLYKLINGNLNCPQLLNKINITITHSLPRLSRYSLFKPKRSKTNLGLYSPINRLQNDYNSICKNKDIDIFYLSLPTFKNKLRILLSNKL